jgi:putative membrane protein
MSEPTSPDDWAVGRPERLHPLFLLTGLGGSLRGVAGGYAAIAYLAVSGRPTIAIIGAIVLLLFLVVGLALYWTRFEFRVGGSDIRIDSGIVSRRHRSIPFDRIQDVDIIQGPIARLLGLAQVKFETGGGGVGPNAEEAVLQAIPLDRAHEIRELIRVSRREVPTTGAVAAADDRPPIYALNVRRLFVAGLFNFSLAVFAALIGLSQTMGEVAGFDPLNRRFWTNVAEGSDPIVKFLLQHRAGAAIAGLVLLLVVGIATGIIRTVFRDYGFRLDRTEVGLRRRRGLLTRTDVTLPASRAQAVIVATGPVRDRFGWRQLRLQSLARDEGGSGDHVLAPLASDREFNVILAELGWRPLGGPIEWRGISPAYVSTFALALSPLFLAMIFQAAFVWPLAVAYGLGLAVLIGLRWLAWCRTAYALDGDRVVIRTGWWRRRVTVLPTAKIQSIDIAENFISRRFGIATLRFGMAGGGTGGHSIPAIPSAMARNLRDDLLGLRP